MNLAVPHSHAMHRADRGALVLPPSVQMRRQSPAAKALSTALRGWIEVVEKTPPGKAYPVFLLGGTMLMPKRMPSGRIGSYTVVDAPPPEKQQESAAEGQPVEAEPTPEAITEAPDGVQQTARPSVTVSVLEKAEALMREREPAGVMQLEAAYLQSMPCPYCVHLAELGVTDILGHHLQLSLGHILDQAAEPMLKAFEANPKRQSLTFRMATAGIFVQINMQPIEPFPLPEEAKEEGATPEGVTPVSVDPDAGAVIATETNAKATQAAKRARVSRKKATHTEPTAPQDLASPVSSESEPSTTARRRAPRASRSGRSRTQSATPAQPSPA